MAPIDPRDFGRLEAEVLSLQKQVEALSKDMKSLLALVERGKGGWFVIVLVGTISGAITALAIKFLPFWPFK
jgi:hypothetical protein